MFWKSIVDALTMWMNCFQYEKIIMRNYIQHVINGFVNQSKQFVENKLVGYAQEGYQHNEPLDKPFEVNEVKAICKKLPNGKAGGPDNLTYKHLKYGGKHAF